MAAVLTSRPNPLLTKAFTTAVEASTVRPSKSFGGPVVAAGSEGLGSATERS